MCLRINRNQEPEIAKEPITCYKCLTRDMVSPCYRQEYKLGQLITSEFSINKASYCDKVEKGLHSFAEESDAKRVARNFGWHDQINDYLGISAPIVIKCEIPIGASYYKAVSDMVCVTYEYASNQLLPLEIISK